MWSQLTDFVLQQERAIELAAAFILGGVYWGTLSITIRAAYRWRSQRKKTPPPEAEIAPPTEEATDGGAVVPADPASIAAEVPADDEILQPELSSPVQDGSFRAGIQRA